MNITSEKWMVMENGKRVKNYSPESPTKILPGQKFGVYQTFINPDNNQMPGITKIETCPCSVKIITIKLASGSWKHTLVVEGENSADVKKLFDFFKIEFLDDSDPAFEMVLRSLFALNGEDDFAGIKKALKDKNGIVAFTIIMM